MKALNKSKVLFILLCLLISLLFVNLFAENNPNLSKATQIRLDSLFTILSTNDKSMGSFALAKDGQTLYTKSIGFKSLEENKKLANDNQTKYRIGSISKMFTSTMIFQLIEDGKLNLDTKLSNYYPEIPHADSITIGMMLSHHSGIYSFTDDPQYMKWCTKKISHKALIKLITKNKETFMPGKSAQYSNSNFVLLGYIIEKLDKTPYEKALEKRIISKIHLNNTFYGGKISLDKNEALSYRFIQQWNENVETDMSIPGGAGAIISTSEDLTKFIYALFNEQLISKQSLDTMITINNDYGYGIFKMPFGDKTAYGHTGGIDSFSSILCYFPEDNVGLAYCSNGTLYSPSRVVLDAYNMYFGMPFTMPEFKKSIKLDNLEIYCGEYYNDTLKMKIKVSTDNNILFAQAHGQSKFPLEAFEMHKFRFEPAGIMISFRTETGEFILNQSSKEFVFKK